VKFGDNIDGLTLKTLFSTLEEDREAGRILSWYIHAGYDDGSGQTLVCVDINVPHGAKLNVTTYSGEAPELLDALLQAITKMPKF